MLSDSSSGQCSMLGGGVTVTERLGISIPDPSWQLETEWWCSTWGSRPGNPPKECFLEELFIHVLPLLKYDLESRKTLGHNHHSGLWSSSCLFRNIAEDCVLQVPDFPEAVWSGPATFQLRKSIRLSGCAMWSTFKAHVCVIVLLDWANYRVMVVEILILYGFKYITSERKTNIANSEE